MATKKSEIYSSRLNSPRSNTYRGMHSDLSDDMRVTSINTIETKNYEKSYLNPLELRTSHDLSLQASTQNSLSFKNSFSFLSPKKGSINQDSIHIRTNSDKFSLRELNKSSDLSILKNSNSAHIQDDLALSVREDENDMIEFEGPDDLKIPSLKWCAHCRAEVMTQVSYVNNRKTFWSAVGIFLSGGVFGCFLLPYMSDSCKGMKVKCHRCDRVLG